MKHIAHIVLLTMSLLLPITMKAQTPYDSFAPETSRPMLEAEVSPGVQPDSILCVIIADLQNQMLLLVRASNGEIVATTPITEDLRKWLSVDPLVDNYPDISPYAYCHWSPINRMDPDGRADYYDIDGNHLCNDGVEDKRVFQQNINGDVVLGGYATPFSYVGDVDKISLLYEGEMISESKSKGELTVTQHVGERQFSKSFSAISGSSGKTPLYTLQNGEYTCSKYVNYNPSTVDAAYVRHGIGFGISLTPDGWTTFRNGLMIHPDGNLPGTAGCIGLTGTASDLTLFQKMVSPFMSGKNTSPLSVSIIGNPQCYRAVNKERNWLTPLFCK